MLSNEDKEKIHGIIMDELGVDDVDITPEANLLNDFGADSLDLYDIGLSLEETFELDMEIEPSQIETVGQIYTLVERAISK